MNWIRKLANHTSQYFLGEILIIISSLISFPIFVRILTEAEYGILTIVSMTIDVVVLFTSAGLRHALFRFYGENLKTSPRQATELFATVFWATVGLSGVGVIFLAGISWLPFDTFKYTDVVHLLAFASVLVLFRNTSELILGLLRIREKTTLFMIGHVTQKYAGMLLAIYFLVFLKMRILGLFKGLVIGEGIILIGLVVYILFLYRSGIWHFSVPRFLECARYGIPLVGQTFSGFINSVGDRYVILFLKGETAVAIYTTGYNLARYVQTLFVDTLEAAMIPLTMNVYAEHGHEKAGEVVAQYYTIYAFIFFPVIFGMFAIARETTIIVASIKYLESAGLVGVVSIGVMIAGLFFPATIGLHLQKKTPVVAQIMFLTAAINMVFNFIFIPIWGIMGAAVATLISCIFQIAYGLFKSRNYLTVKHNYHFYVTCLLGAVIMYLALFFAPQNETGNILLLVLRIAGGFLVYLAAVLALDRNARQRTRGLYQKMRLKLS